MEAVNEVQLEEDFPAAGAAGERLGRTLMDSASVVQVLEDGSVNAVQIPDDGSCKCGTASRGRTLQMQCRSWKTDL